MNGRAWQHATGLSAKLCCGRPYRELVPAQADADAEEEWDRLLLDGDADGGVCCSFVSHLAAPLQALGEWSCFRDRVHERQYAVGRQQSAADGAQDEVAAVQLARRNHEIRTPLNAMLGMAVLLADTPPSAEQREYLCVLRDSGWRLLATLDRCLTRTPRAHHAGLGGVRA